MRSHRLIRLVLSLIALSAGQVWASPSARAGVTMSVAPSLVEVRATGEGRAQQELTVYNDGSDPFHVTATVASYKEAAFEISAVEWLSVEPTSFELNPGEQRVVTVTIAVPPGLPSGGRYAMVALRTSGAPLGGSNAAVSGQLGVPFLITMDTGGALSRDATLTEFAPVIEDDGRLGFRTLLENRGNLHVTSRGGAVELAGADGAAAGRLELPKTTAVLPDGDELLAAEGSLPFVEGAAYRARAAVEYGGVAPAIAETDFTARAGLAVINLGLTENLDRGPTLRTELRNQGELGILPRVQMAVRDAEGKVLGMTELIKPPPIWSGQQAVIDAVFPRRLGAGQYTLLARVEYGAAELIEREVSFRIGSGSAAAPNPAWAEERARADAVADQASDEASVPWPLAAAGLMLVIVIGAALVRLVVGRSVEANPPARRALILTGGSASVQTAAALLEEIGYVVERCATADEVSRLVAGEMPDAAVLDAGLPGVQVMRSYGAIRAAAGGALIPVVFVNHVGDAESGSELDVYLGPSARPEAVVRTLRSRVAAAARIRSSQTVPVAV